MNQDGSNSLAKELGKRILNTTLPEMTHDFYAIYINIWIYIISKKLLDNSIINSIQGELLEKLLEKGENPNKDNTISNLLNELKGNYDSIDSNIMNIYVKQGAVTDELKTKILTYIYFDTTSNKYVIVLKLNNLNEGTRERLHTDKYKINADNNDIIIETDEKKYNQSNVRKDDNFKLPANIDMYYTLIIKK